jgi:hypothetical protein
VRKLTTGKSTFNRTERSYRYISITTEIKMDSYSERNRSERRLLKNSKTGKTD